MLDGVVLVCASLVDLVLLFRKWASWRDFLAIFVSGLVTGLAAGWGRPRIAVGLSASFGLLLALGLRVGECRDPDRNRALRSWRRQHQTSLLTAVMWLQIAVALLASVLFAVAQNVGLGSVALGIAILLVALEQGLVLRRPP